MGINVLNLIFFTTYISVKYIFTNTYVFVADVASLLFLTLSAKIKIPKTVGYSMVIRSGVILFLKLH